MAFRGGLRDPHGSGVGCKPTTPRSEKSTNGGLHPPLWGARSRGAWRRRNKPCPLQKKKNNQKKLCKAFRGGVRLPLLVSVAAREDGGGIFPSPRIARSLNKGTGNAAQPSGGKHAADPPGLPRLLPAARPRPAPPGSQPPPPPLLSPPLFSPSSPGKSEVSC